MTQHAIERFLNVKVAYRPDFSASGRHLAFLSDVTGVAQVWRRPLDVPPDCMPWPEQLTFSDDRVMWLRHVPVPGDGRLLFARDRGGNENAQLFLLDTAQGTETCLTEGWDGAMHIPGDWIDDGRAVLFSANRADPMHFGLYRQPLDGGGATLLWQSDRPGYLYDATPHPNANRVLVMRMGRSAAFDLLEIDLETREARELSPADRPARYLHATYSHDGRSVLVVTDLDSDTTYLARLDLTTGGWARLADPGHDVEWMTLSADGRTVAYTVNENGYGRLHTLDLASGATRPCPPSDEGVIGWWDETLAFSPDGRRIAFSLTGPTFTSDIYVWEPAAGAPPTALTRMSHGGIPRDEFAPAELVTYPSFDGLRIPAWLYRPAAADRPSPVVVIVHGGPESQARPIFLFLAQYLVERGYAVLLPNVRGSTGYGKVYEHLDDVEKRLDSVADLAYAARWLKAQPGIDGDRIAVYGGSYGGFMVLAALAFHPDLWAAGVDIVGISNFVTFLENTSDYRRQHRESEYGSLAADRAFLEEISPLNHIEAITAPLLVIHGANDPRVPVSEAEQLTDRLRELGRTVELLIFDDEGHGIARLKNKLVAYPAVAAFLDRVLGAG